jgi:hypothetical protein
MPLTLYYQSAERITTITIYDLSLIHLEYKTNLNIVPDFLQFINVGTLGEADVRGKTDLNHFQGQWASEVAA